MTESERQSSLVEEARTEEKETGFSGSFGFVIKPDNKTQAMAEELSVDLFPESEYRTMAPHITLFHAKVENLPEREVKKIIDGLKGFRDKKIHLGRVEVFGGKFAFWHADMDADLMSMHKETLTMARFVDKRAIQRAVEEGLNLSEKELENVRRFGHPLVNDCYKPHITLAYDSEGLVLPKDNVFMSWEMKVDDVLFSEMGKYGSVARVIEF